MKIGPLTRSAGLVDVEHTDASRAKIETEAMMFLLAGGTLSLAEWEHLPEKEKVAFTAAGRRFMHERARAFLDIFTPSEEELARSMLAEGLEKAHGHPSAT